ncbi:MFS transporter, partial [Klebsiella grimontii]|uniref:MFS transporter n=1 Tax=Klebsiella grimontii TaxID=2058152 RepID=UPI0015B177D8
VFAGKKSAQIREILISESAWEEMTCLFAPSLGYQAMLYVGNVVVSSPAGFMYDRIGFEKTYIIMGMIALVFTVISAFTLSSCQSKRRSSATLNVSENNASK